MFNNDWLNLHNPCCLARELKSIHISKNAEFVDHRQNSQADYTKFSYVWQEPYSHGLLMILDGSQFKKLSIRNYVEQICTKTVYQNLVEKLSTLSM